MTFPCMYIVHFDIYFFLPFLVPFLLITFPSQLVLFLILFLLPPPPLILPPFLWVAQWVSLGLLRELWVRGWSQEHGTFSVTISPKKMSLLLLATLAAWKHSGRSVTHDRYRYSCCQVQEAMAMPCPGFSVAHHLTSVCFWFLYTSSLSMFFESGEG